MVAWSVPASTGSEDAPFCAVSRILSQTGSTDRRSGSIGTPTPSVVLAPLFPVEGWIVSALYVGRTAHIGASIGSIGGGTMLLIAAGIWLLRRRVR